MCALVTGNTVSCWGYNFFGQLGNGSSSNSAQPIAVNGISASAIGGGAEFGCAVAGDVLQCWGINLAGHLGDGNNFIRSLPVVVILP